MENNIRTFRDFLQFYNLMSETCFAHCIDTFKTRELERYEIDCVEKCAHKLIRFNNRTIGVYADIQTNLMTKRAKEMEAQQNSIADSDTGLLQNASDLDTNISVQDVNNGNISSS